MSAADDENAGAAGSLESISYEMGVGLGVTFFGVLLLSEVFSKKIILNETIIAHVPHNVYHSINDALVIANNVGGNIGATIQHQSKVAFESAHSAVLLVSSIILTFFSLQMTYKYFIYKKRAKIHQK